jgi:membrane fusion protein (multidrug efflux system)
VNPTTGSVAFRGKVSNPDRVLLPGLYVTVELTAGTLNKGFRVPQLAVLRDGQGPYVLVAGADGMAAQKRVETMSVVGSDWIISSGLADGDQVIVDHLQMVQPGMPVSPQPAGAGAPAPDGAPAAGPEQGKPAAEAST